MAFDAKTERLISLKKLSGKAHTSNDKGLPNEGLPSGITMSTATIFAESIPTSPTATPYQITGGTVEFLRLPVSFILGSDTSDGRHGFELKLPSDYESNSSNPNAGSGVFVNNKVLNTSGGKLQLIPPSFATAYEAKPHYGSIGSGTRIYLLDDRDWNLDYFNGVLFQQDPPGTGDHAQNPTYVEAYIYIGDYLDGSSGASGDITAVTAGNGLTGGANSGVANLAVGAGLGITVNSNDVAINNSIVATLTGSQFSGNVGITGSLGVHGDMGVAQFIKHIGDDDTFIQFADDSIGITAGGEQLITISEAGQDIVKIGDGGDVDFQVRTLNDDNTLYIQGSTDRVGIGTNSPSSILHIKEAAPTLTFQRENNSNASTINFIGHQGNTANSIVHDSSTNDLVFKTFNGTTVEEIMRLGDHYGTPNRQVIFLSGSTMHGGAMHPRNCSDIAFFVSGSINSIGTSVKGAAVFGGDTVVSGTIQAMGGISGSLQQLSNGTSYLREGSNISITSGSDGSITISSSDSSTTSFGSVGLSTGPRKSEYTGATTTAGNNKSVSNSDFSSVDYDPSSIDIFLNGILLHSGSSANVSGNDADYYLTGASTLKFGFDINNDDILDVVVSSESKMKAAPYITFEAHSILPNERVLRVSNVLSLTTGSVGQIDLDIDRKKEILLINSNLSSGNPLSTGINFSQVSYSPSRIDVYLNGQMLLSGSSKDYTLQPTSNIVFNFDLLKDDSVIVLMI